MLLLCAGCSSGPAPRLYVLSPPAGGVAGARSPSGQPRVQLQPILVPDYLDTTDVLLRSGPHELKVSRTAQWAERLSTGMTHALFAALEERLPGDFITLDPRGDESARQIRVDVAAFDVWSDGRCVLTASWIVLEKDPRPRLEAGRATFEIPAVKPGLADDAAVVAAMARALGQLADRVAEEIQ